jgi:DNA-binding response OmpR family regulator
MNRRVFIIDDEPDMIKIATDLLESEGYVVSSATHPRDGLKKIQANPPDLLLLDLRLPDVTGFDLCKQIKADPKTRGVPVIMVSVQSEEMDIVLGLEVGADDYISKPFRKRELLARVKAVLRRHTDEPAPQRVEVGPITLDYKSYSARVNKKTLELTPKEFELLGFFLKREGHILTRAVISESVWGHEHHGSSRTIDVHVDQLRKKLGSLSDWIKSLKGVGYRFEPD